MSEGSHVVVIGGGIVGLCCAHYLLQSGYKVSLVEPGESDESTTAASCGYIAISEIIPHSTPGTLRKLPGWLLRPSSPLFLKPSSLPTIWPWFRHFLQNTNHEKCAQITRALASLTQHAWNDYEKLLGKLGLSHLVRDIPVMEVYENEQQLAHERPYHEQRRSLGMDVEEITGKEAAEMEPELAKDFASAVVFRDWRMVTDPSRFLAELTKEFTNNGGKLITGRVNEFVKLSNNVTGVKLNNGKTIEAGKSVLCAGTGSKTLLKQLGITIQLEGVKGYQTLISEPGIDVRHGVFYAAGGYGITPYDSGLSIAGTLEFSSVDTQPDFRRAEILVERTKRVLPGLRNVQGRQRVGVRPMCPDTVPIIDRVTPDVVVATGHGQLGLTLGATTGRLVAQLVAGEQPSIDLSSFRATRF